MLGLVHGHAAEGKDIPMLEFSPKPARDHDAQASFGLSAALTTPFTPTLADRKSVV